MTTKLILFALGGSLLLATPALLAQTNCATNSSPANGSDAQHRVAQNAGASEQSPRPPDLEVKTNLTAPPQTVKPIAEAFAKTSWEFETTDQARIEAALEANRQARTAKDEAQLQAARTRINQIWAGLPAAQVTDANQIKPPQPPEQLRILEDKQNQGREDYTAEADVPVTN